MRDKGPPAFVAVLLALVGLRVALPDSRALPKAEAQAAPAAPADTEKTREDEQGEAGTPRGPLHRFRSSGFETPRGEGAADVPGWKLRWLIACVPDPIDSSSGDRFDGFVDAIQRAVETRHYVLDDFYYPWPEYQRKEKRTPRSPRSGAGETNSLELRAGGQRLQLTLGQVKKAGPRFRSEPGVLLFRKRYHGDDSDLEEPGRLLLVFLVGETATAGIHKEAFAASLRLIAGSREFNEVATVRVLGPYFSGSQVSLEQVILGWAKELGASEGRLPGGRPLTVRIISGSATGIDKKNLEDVLRPCGKVTFHATIIPNRIALRKLLVYANLAEEQGKEALRFKGNVAILYESNTAFGQHAVFGPEAITRREQDQRPEPEHLPTLFPFPLHISEVRAAYQQTVGPTKGDTVRLPSFGSKLHLQLDKGRGTRETEPSLNSAMTAVMSERVLNTTLNAIAHERFRYVLIVATDVKDVLFLATLVRGHCPRSRLLLCCNDLLHTHPDFNFDLRGSLVASTYPLYPRNQHWSFPFRGDKERILFPGQAEQGYYNATVALLFPHHPEHLIEYGPPFPGALPEGWTDAHKPPVWISIIGQGGVFPVAVFPADDDDHVFTAEGASRARERFVPVHTTLWIVPVLALILLLGYAGFSYLYVARRYSWWGEREPDENAPTLGKLLWPLPDGSPTASLRRRQQLYAFACLAPVLVLYAYVTFVWLIPPLHLVLFGDKSPVSIRWPWGWVMPGVLLSLPLVLLVLVLLSRAPHFSWKVCVPQVFLLLLPRLLLLLLLLFFPAVTLVLLLRLTLLLFSELDPLVLLGLFVLAACVVLAGLRFLAPRPTPKAGDTGTPAGVRWRRRLAEHRFLLFSVYVLSVLFTYLVVYGSRPQWPRHGQLLFFFDRATNLANGVTPVVPLFLLGMAIFCWGYVNLKRLYLLRQPVLNPFAPEKPFKHIAARHSEVEEDLVSPTRALASPGALVAGLALFFTFCRLAGGFVPSVEDVATESILLLGLAVLALLIVCGFLHLLKVWRGMRKLLQAIALKPLGGALERLPASITALFGTYLSSQRPGRGGHLLAREERQRDLRNGFNKLRETLGDELWDILDLHYCSRADLEGSLAQPSATLAGTARTCSTLLEHLWSRPELAAKLLGPEAPKEGDQSKAPPAPAVTSVRRWLALVEEFVALETVAFLSQYLVQLRNMLVFLITAPLLLLLALSSYPFQPQRLWLFLATVLLGVVALSTMWILIQIERNEVLSHTLNTTPHRLNFHWGFLGHFLLAAAPLLAIPVIASSDLSDLVHAWFDPVLQLTK